MLGRVATCGIARRALIADASMVGHWPLEDGQALDISGNGSNGLLTSVLPDIGNGPAMGHGARGFAFNGTSSLIDLGNKDVFGRISTTATWAIWYKWDQTVHASGWNCFFSKGPFSSAAYSLIMNQGTRGVRFYVNGADQFALVDPAVPNDGNWHHIAFVLDGVNAICYLDGAILVSNASTVTVPAIAVSVKIGADTSPFWFGGSLRDAWMFRRALGHSEIFALMLSSGLSAIDEIEMSPLWYGNVSIGDILYSQIVC